VKSESLLFGTVGMCRPEKNQQVLLTTLRQMLAARIDAHLAICGDGPLRAMLERRATELGIAERVHFTGALEDVRPVLSALDIFVLPSIAVESFSNAALEAMAMGRPVILSDIGGAREMVSDGVEGYVVSATEVPARLPAIMAALCADRRKRQLMGAAARSRAINCFSVTAMVAGYRGLFHDGEAQ
jgi:glycosyltransferase involved in cell wall biosynthesis